MPPPVAMNNNPLQESPMRQSPVSASSEPPLQDGINPRQLDNLSSGRPSHGQQDGSTSHSPGGRRFIRDPTAERSLSNSSPFRLQMPFVTSAQLAFSALQFLPVPVLVLNSLKTVVLANEAMGRLLGLIPDSADSSGADASHILEQLNGQSLSQVGIDMIQNGRPVWVAWDTFLDSVVNEVGMSHSKPSDSEQKELQGHFGDATPTADGTEDKRSPAHPGQSQQTVIEVVVSRHDMQKSIFIPRKPTTRSSDNQMHAKMIISVWEMNNHQTYFTLTFTNTESVSPEGSKKRTVARPGSLEAAERKTIPITSNPGSVTSSHGSSSSPSYRVSPSSVSLSSSPFPPLGPPFKSLQSTPSVLQKMMIIKDSLLDNTETPIIAMWKDCTVAYPNAACRKLMNHSVIDSSSDGADILNNWVVYSEDFSRVLEPHEYPIAILLDTQTPYSGLRVGIIDQNGKRLVLDILAEAIRDEETDEFLAGVVTCRDVTKMAKEIDKMKERDAERFKTICDIIPQLVWTTDAEGSLDFFNTRWTDFTGMSLEESLGVYKWTKCFHPDDMAETRKKWEYSLRTGAPYSVEYRCQTREGDWRWLLGRAMPLRNPDTGKIEKWFGTCTDVHESIETKLAARRTRQQLLSVIAHAHVTIFTVDLHRKITMLEGALIENEGFNRSGDHSWSIGGNVDEVFNHLHPELPAGQRPDFLSAIDAIIARKTSDVVVEHGISKFPSSSRQEGEALSSRWLTFLDNRHFRTRFLPMTIKKRKGETKGEESEGVSDGKKDYTPDNDIEGVIGIIMDVTEVKAKEAVLEVQAKEKQQLLANEAAAKEASRLKSQFLANVSFGTHGSVLLSQC